MNKQPKRISIAQPLMNILSTDPSMKAVISPDKQDQRITRLVASDTRIFECDVLCEDKASYELPDKALVIFHDRDIERIMKLQDIVSDINVNHIVVSALFDAVGEADFEQYTWSNNIIHKCARIDETHIVQQAYLNNTRIQVATDNVDIKLLTKKYPDDELISYDELSLLDYQVEIIGINSDGEAVLPDREYTEASEHPEYPFEDWQYEVANGDTRISYDDWVKHSLERDEELSNSATL